MCLIVIIAKKDWYGLIPKFDFPHGVFSHFRLWRENPAGFFEKIKSYIFNCISLQNNIEAELKFSHHLKPLKQIKNLRGFPPPGFTPTK